MPLTRSITKKEDNEKFKIMSELPDLKNFDLIFFCVKHDYYKKINLKNFQKNQFILT